MGTCPIINLPLHLALAAVLGLLSFLSTLMLGLGQGDIALPILMGIAAIASFVLTDQRRVIQLGDWTVNTFAIFIVCFNIFDVLNHSGEFLAWAIARVLVFVQIVLLFREKETRFCWQILLISLLQVAVATVFQQSILFGALLLSYVFVGLCAFILLFLQQEHRYFRSHSFVKTLLESIKAEMSERQDRRELFRIALLTLLMGPISLVLSFGKKKIDQTLTSQEEQRKEIFRKLFLIFPTDEDRAQKERWETVEDESVNANPVLAESVSSFHVVSRRSDTASSFTSRRFPLLTKRPSFSAGTRNPRPWSGNWRELFYHLTIGTLFAFFMAVIIFCLIPRIGTIEVNDQTIKQGIEQWTQSVRQRISVGTVGINDKIQLGSLGSVIPHHREVIKVRFLHKPDNTLIMESDSSATPYRAIAGATLYFRGIPLDPYSDGTWTQRPTPPPEPARMLPPGGIVIMSGRAVPFQPDSLQQSAPLLHDPHTLQPAPPQQTTTPYPIGAILPPQEQQSAFFEKDCDLVTLVMSIQPLDTKIFFAPHPFFSTENMGLHNTNGRSVESIDRRSATNKTIVSTAFKHGSQLDLVPCQEKINSDDLLQIPGKGLESLKVLAVRWDAESGCAQEDIVGRARFMEQKFLYSQEFAYQLGGTLRDYDLDPLEDFIAHNPKGHCEYFAGALALMLRSVGISSRVVIGFKTEAMEYNASCTIRQSDAHAWVEVYIPPEKMPNRTTSQYASWWKNGGWLRLDPTPVSDSSAFMTNLSLQWTDWTRSIQSFWNEFVLNMNPNSQTYWIYEPLQRAGHYIVHSVFNVEFWREFWTDMVWYYRSFFADAPQQERRMWDGFYLMPPFVILGLLGLAFWRLYAMLRVSDRKRRTEEVRRRITIEFYLRMERILSKIGLIRSSHVTPLEFARQSSFAPLMLPVVESFYRVRFGNTVLSAEESQSVLRTLDELERLLAPSV